MRAELNGHSLMLRLARCRIWWCLAEIKRRNGLKEFPFDDSEVTSLYREKVANGELPDVYAGTPYDLALLLQHSFPFRPGFLGGITEYRTYFYNTTHHTTTDHELRTTMSQPNFLPPALSPRPPPTEQSAKEGTARRNGLGESSGEGQLHHEIMLVGFQLREKGTPGNSERPRFTARSTLR